MAESQKHHPPNLLSRLVEDDLDETILLSSAEITLTPPASPSQLPVGRSARTTTAAAAVWSNKLALQRRHKLRDAQRHAAQRMEQQQLELDQSSSSSRLRNRQQQRLQKGWQTAKKAMHKVNIGKWIDDLEKDQDLADQLERINVEHSAEVERRQLVLRVREECMDALRTHLVSFLQETPEGRCYEDWIAEVHPENVNDDDQVDARFYVQDSDHRILWNEHHVNTEDRAFGFSQIVHAVSVEEKTQGSTVHHREDDDVVVDDDVGKKRVDPVIQQV